VILVFIYLAAFWFTMVFHQVSMKMADTHPKYQLAIFIMGNVIAVGGTWFIVLLHGRLQANLVVGLSMGLGFLMCQIAMSVLDRKFSPTILMGAVLITLGILLLSTGQKSSSQDIETAGQSIMQELSYEKR